MTSKCIYPQYALPKGFRVSDTETFIQKSRSVHGDKYEYHKSVYKDTWTRVVITCSTHGDFDMLPSTHYSGQGCKHCWVERSSKARRYDTKKFVEKAKKVHGRFYDYSKVEYVSSKDKVVIICPNHGDFLANPSQHLRGVKCRKCRTDESILRLTYSQEDFENRVKEIHGEDRYDLRQAVYTHNRTPVLVICKYHKNNPFKIEPNSLFNGRGCPYCAKEILCNSNTERWEKSYTELTLYHVRIFNEETSFEKVGVTSKKIENRMRTLESDGFEYEVIMSVKGKFDEISRIENEIFDHLNREGQRYRIRHLKGTRTGGWSECFHEGLINLNDFTDCLMGAAR